ncbi:hypothetical protein AMEX_G22083 [Astyanax mexicanus]|uniref:Ig-like domain-containing protein n=1 Tax=Astyanax mexicanus TaxID=7994 RepID=A0A8T2KZ23_ASTMX|nr:hypothetical protein AMEX_G22083 [Astyanax mexicanus]
MTLPLILVVLTMPVFRAVPVEEPNITLLAREDDDTVKLLCLLEDFYPKTYTNIMWLKDKAPFSGSPVTRTIISSKRRYYQISEIHFDAQQLNKSTEYTCQASHNPEIIKSTWSNYKDKFSLKINPPSEKDLFVQNKAVITCVITGDNKKEVEAAKVSWTFGGQTRASTATDNVKGTTAPFTKSSNLTLSESEWFSGKEVKCSTERDKTPFSDKIKVKKGGERPSVRFYKPENDVRDTDKVSLLCEVSSSDLGDVYIMWQKNNDPYMKGSSTVRINDNTVLSYLTVTGKEYNDKHNAFTCAVKDANKENDTNPRINSTSASKLPPCPLCPAD